MSDHFQALIARARELRHELHRHPETLFALDRSADLVRRELDRLGIAWRTCAGTGTVARIEAAGDGPCIAWRADMDALAMDERSAVPWASQEPGLMHACGHDGHTATLLAAAGWLQAQRGRVPGPVVFLFQPAEEGGHGARAMVEDGALDGVDHIYGWHNWPNAAAGRVACPDGCVMAANGHFDITFTGRGGHASQPERCRDPIVAAATFVAQVQQVVSRQVAPQLAAVVSITQLHAGSNHNSIPETAVLQGTVRAVETELRDDLARRVEVIATQVATAAEMTVEVAFQPDYRATVNAPEAAARLRAAAAAEFGSDCLDDHGLPVMGAEDFSYYLAHRPGAFALIGAHGEHPCHSPYFDFDDDLIAPMVRVMARVVGLEPGDAAVEAGAAR